MAPSSKAPAAEMEADWAAADVPATKVAMYAFGAPWLGAGVGELEGSGEGDGLDVGVLVGAALGSTEGATEGSTEGATEGAGDGAMEGSMEGAGETSGEGEGELEGSLEGAGLLLADGSGDGLGSAPRVAAGPNSEVTMRAICRKIRPLNPRRFIDRCSRLTRSPRRSLPSTKYGPPPRAGGVPSCLPLNPLTARGAQAIGNSTYIGGWRKLPGGHPSAIRGGTDADTE
jgi:hypothetical protein